MGNHCHGHQRGAEGILCLWWKLKVSLYIPKAFFYLIAKRVSH